MQKEKVTQKTTTIAQFVAQQIAQWCQCQYSSSFITDSQLFCTTNNNVVYQGQLLPTDNKTALEIRNITQLWVLRKPVIMMDGQSYQLHSNCSVVVKELGVTSCGTGGYNVTLPTSQPAVSMIELVSVVGTGVMLLLVIALVISLILCCVCKKKSKSFDVR